MLKTMKFKVLCLFFSWVFLLTTVCFASSEDTKEHMSLADYIQTCGVTLNDDSIIMIKYTGEDRIPSQYIEIINTFSDGIMEKSIIRPFYQDSCASRTLIDTNKKIISVRSTGYTDVNFSSIGITVTVNAYYSGTDTWGYVPYGVTAKWTRGSGITSTVSQMNARFFIRGELVYFDTGALICSDYVYDCPLTQVNPVQNIYYTKAQSLPYSNTAIVTGLSPIYGGGVFITVEVNGVPYEDDIGL